MTTNAGFIYLGDGVTTTYPISFSFDDPLDVSITLDGVLLEMGVTPNGGNGFTISGSNFTFTSAPDVGANIFGLRTTDLEFLFEFANKSTLEKDALDGMYKQLLYALQEGVAVGERLEYVIDALVNGIIADNTADIAANTAAITINDADIAANTSGIAANTAALISINPTAVIIPTNTVLGRVSPLDGDVEVLTATQLGALLESGGGTVDTTAIEGRIDANEDAIVSLGTTGVSARNTINGRLDANEADIVALQGAPIGGSNTITVPMPVVLPVSTIAMLTPAGAITPAGGQITGTLSLDGEYQRTIDLLSSNQDSVALSDDIVAIVAATRTAGGSGIVDFHLELWQKSTGLTSRLSAEYLGSFPRSLPKIVYLSAYDIFAVAYTNGAGGITIRTYSYDPVTLLVTQLQAFSNSTSTLYGDYLGMTCYDGSSLFIVNAAIAEDSIYRLQVTVSAAGVMQSTTSGFIFTQDASALARIDSVERLNDSYSIFQYRSVLYVIQMDGGGFFSIAAPNLIGNCSITVKGNNVSAFVFDGAASRFVLYTYLHDGAGSLTEVSVRSFNVNDIIVYSSSQQTYEIADDIFLCQGVTINQGVAEYSPILVDFVELTTYAVSPVGSLNAYSAASCILGITGSDVSFFVVNNDVGNSNTNVSFETLSLGRGAPQPHSLCIVDSITATEASVIPTGGFGTITPSGTVGDTYYVSGEPVGRYITSNTIILTATNIGV